MKSNSTMSEHHTLYSVISDRFTDINYLSLAIEECQECSPHFTWRETQKQSVFPSGMRLQPSEQRRRYGQSCLPALQLTDVAGCTRKQSLLYKTYLGNSHLQHHLA